MDVDRLHLLTGPPGAGKSTLAAELARQGVATSGEVGRQVLREQLSVGGTALPWGDERAFAALMLPREIAAREHALGLGVDVVLDRGVPDVIGFLIASGLPVPEPMWAAARTHRYARDVFFAPFWASIFVQDGERPFTADAYRRSEAALREVYAALGYRLVELPLADVGERAAFVRGALHDG